MQTKFFTKTTTNMPFSQPPRNLPTIQTVEKRQNHECSPLGVEAYIEHHKENSLNQKDTIQTCASTNLGVSSRRLRAHSASEVCQSKISLSPPAGTATPPISSLPPRPRSYSSDPLESLQSQLLRRIQVYGPSHWSNVQVLNEMGNLHFRRGQHRAAQKCYQRALACDRGPYTAMACTNLGTVCWSIGELDHAQHWLVQALQCWERDCQVQNRTLQDSPMVASVYHQLGLVAALQNNYDMAIQQLTVAWQIRTGLGLNEDEGKTLDVMGKICSMQGRFPSAAEYHRQAYRVLRSEPCGGVGALRNLAATYEAAGERSNAEIVLGVIKRKRQHATTLTQPKRLAPNDLSPSS